MLEDDPIKKLFEKECSDAYKSLSSKNPIARNQARAMYWAFSRGYLARETKDAV